MTAHPIDTEALRKLADAATEGPWVQNGRNGIHTPIGSCVALTHRHDDDERKADAEFIAAARTAVLALLDENAALRARIKAVEDVLELHGPAHDGPWQDEADCGPQIIADIRRALTA